MPSHQLIKKAYKNIGIKINKKGIKFSKQANLLDKMEINGTVMPLLL